MRPEKRAPKPKKVPTAQGSPRPAPTSEDRALQDSGARSASSQEAVHREPAVQDQTVPSRRQLEQLGEPLKALEALLRARERRTAELEEQLAGAQAQVREAHAELEALRAVYRCVGERTISMANRFDAAKRRIPDALSQLGAMARRLTGGLGSQR